MTNFKEDLLIKVFMVNIEKVDITHFQEDQNLTLDKIDEDTKDTRYLGRSYHPPFIELL